jgi:hypothetical protein
MAQPKKQTPKDAAPSKPNRTEARKQQNRDANDLRHQQNLAAVRELGLPSEKTERIVTRVVKRGKKTELKTTTIVKDKTPSKLLRKERRRLAAIALGNEITNLEQKINA